MEIKGFLTLFACWRKDPDPYKTMTDPDPAGQKTYGSGFTTLLNNKPNIIPLVNANAVQSRRTLLNRWVQYATYSMHCNTVKCTDGFSDFNNGTWWYSPEFQWVLPLIANCILRLKNIPYSLCTQMTPNIFYHIFAYGIKKTISKP